MLNNTLLERDSVFENRTDRTLRDLIWSHGGVLTLLDIVEHMNKLDVDSLIDLCLTFGSALPDQTVATMLRHDATTNFDSLISLCLALDCPCSTDNARKIIKLMTSDEPPDKQRFHHLLQSLHENLRTELSTKVMLFVDPAMSSKWLNPYEDWTEVIDKWPETLTDIEGASKSLAADMPTACVFHLSRIGENGLRKTCAKYVPANDLPQAPYQMMGKYLECIENFVKKNHKAAGAAELTEAATYFKPIKTVWRDDVSHVGSVYTMKDADKCYRAIRDMLDACAKLV